MFAGSYDRKYKFISSKKKPQRPGGGVGLRGQKFPKEFLTHTNEFSIKSELKNI